MFSTALSARNKASLHTVYLPLSKHLFMHKIDSKKVTFLQKKYFIQIHYLLAVFNDKYTGVLEDAELSGKDS